MSRKITFFACLIALGTVFLAGCNEEQNQRSIITVSKMNNNEPFFSDVYDATTGTVAEDWCPVTFQNIANPYAIVDAGQPFGDFVVTNYRIDWRRVDGTGGVPAPYQGAWSVNVPSGEEVTAAFLLVPYETKNTPLMMDIRQGGASYPDEYLMIAKVTFYGHEVGTDRGREFISEVSVSFADAPETP